MLIWGVGCKWLDCSFMVEGRESWCGRQFSGSLKRLIIKFVVRSYTRLREIQWNSLEVRKTAADSVLKL